MNEPSHTIYVRAGDPDLTGAPGGLCISVVSAHGTGQTSLSAFDDALWKCGVHDYNLMRLSSVIPPASEIVSIPRHAAASGELGHRLYVVMAEMRSETPGAVIGAGIGWYQWGDGQGVFVEHELASPPGSSADAGAEITRQIHASLQDLTARRGVSFDEERVGICLEVARVGEAPACALVLSIYQSEGWAGRN